MRARLKRATQIALTRLGPHCSPFLIHHLDAAIGYLETGRWLHARGFTIPHRYPTNLEVWQAIAPEIRDERVLYMEFGVWRGDSIRAWANLLRHPEAMLHGFDSFQGLPAHFNPGMPVGHFSTSGQLPAIDDPRVRFFPGWFEDTLPSYQWPNAYDRLLINFDADLYTSTALVLGFLNDRIAPGTFLYFDEFNDHDHELRAFSDFIDKTGMAFRVRAARSELGSIIFERLA